MAILVMGATGGQGRASVEALQEAGYEVIAGVHHLNKANDLKHQGIEVRKIDLVNDSINQMVEKLDNVDNIIFNAAENKYRGDVALLTDLDGADKLIEAAKKKHVRHFITVTAQGTNKRDEWSRYGEDIATILLAKFYQEKLLKASGLIYTIIRPDILTNEPASNQISISGGGAAVSRNDIAHLEVQALTDQRAFNKEFDIFSGTQTVDEVFDEL